MMASSLNSLGVCYQRGIGVDKNLTAAADLYQRAIKLDDTHAMNNLAWMHQYGLQSGAPNYPVARDCYQQAAAKGDEAGMNHLAILLQNNWGVTRNFGKAREWFEKAAGEGNADAMNNLGWMHGTGLGTQQNYAEAMFWYVRGAANGHSVAANNIGVLYANGFGVPRDEIAAVSWFQRASAMDSSAATKHLDHLLYEPMQASLDALGRAVDAGANAQELNAIFSRVTQYGQPVPESALALLHHGLDQAARKQAEEAARARLARLMSIAAGVAFALSMLAFAKSRRV